MCGIVGIINFDEQPVQKKDLIKFRDSLIHRGPDGEGIYLSKNNSIGLGHRRLKILDLSSDASQPMSYSNERYWIVYNGEIYNFLEIRKELESLNFRFRTNSDTEVILAAFMHWGDKCQQKFNGMWAFAILDNLKKTIFLSRDRFGVKPLYFIHKDNKLIFASELKSFMHLPENMIPEFNLDTLASLGKNIKSTILKTVKQLKPGSQAIFSYNGDVKHKKWWNTLNNTKKLESSYEEQVEHFKYLFNDACKIRMRSDVPICSSLSGGLDSSAVVSMMNMIRNESRNYERQHKNNQSAFICDFIGSSDYEVYSERKYADQVIDFTGATPFHINFQLDSVCSDEIKKSTYYQELIGEPGIGPWRIYQSMRNNNRIVTLDGHAGDELLAGYPTHMPSAILDAYSHGTNTYLREILEIESRLSMGKIKKQNEITSRLKNLINDYFPLLKNFIKKFKKNSISNNINNFINIDYINTLDESYELLEGVSNLHQVLYHDFHYGSLQGNLHKFDRLSMAHGVEVRAPLLDFRLVAFIFSLGNQAKIGGGFTKRILRDSMNGLMPDDVRLRMSKSGFDPMEEWYKTSVSEFINDSINSKKFLESSIWKGKDIKEFYSKNHDIVTSKKIFRFAQTHQLMESFNEAKLYS